jgi:hypothetical protein
MCSKLRQQTYFNERNLVIEMNKRKWNNAVVHVSHIYNLTMTEIAEMKRLSLSVVCAGQVL